jgi:hypothetical protein
MVYVLGIIMATITLIVATVLGFFVLIEKKRTKKTTTSTSTPTTKTPKNWGKILRWMVFLVVTGTVLFLWYKHIEVRERLVVATKAVAVKQPAETEYEWYWELLAGQYVFSGRNHVDPRETSLERVRLDLGNDYLWFDQHYVEGGRPEIMRIRLQKKAEKEWEGPWEQDNPPGHGYITLREIRPGIYGGTRTWSSGKSTKTCNIWKK